ncbi:MAG: fluoride efflux transporter CrcB [Ferruginibacter sp.]|nr:fluoride efflux transporter CrcB [Ferruginibacter sp.]
MKLSTVFIIGLGGFIGTIFRYFTSLFFTKQLPSSFIPYGTFTVNILGCLLIGLVYGISERCDIFSPQWRLFLATGICGGFTTFSAFAYENVSMLQQSNYIGFAIYALSSFLLCLIAVFAGLSFIKML